MTWVGSADYHLPSVASIFPGHNIQQWLSTDKTLYLLTNQLEGAVYIECIPFTETRDYVRKVMNNTMYYSRLFGQSYVSLKQRLGVIGPRPIDNE